ncbi:MAG: zinc dependent phospholipase C family protein [Spirochaetia bacterium]
MPAHITHYLFVKEALRRAFAGRGDRLLEEYEAIFAFASQGPDLFYHNQRTRPGAFKYGRILHRGGYGSFLTALAARIIPDIRDLHGDSGAIHCKEGALMLGLATHAVLDRFTHPFIISRSGWVEPGKGASKKYFRIHAFYERIIDRLLYEHLTGESLFDFDFYLPLSRIDKDMEWFQRELIQSVFTAYPDLNKPDLSRRRLRNALRDALYFYRLTDPTREDSAYKAYLRDERYGRKKRYLALYHPRVLDPGVDYMNTERSGWPDPFEKNYTRYESFYDLFEEAIETMVSIFREIERLFIRRGVTEDFEAVIGNGNLSNGAMDKAPEPLYSDPLDLNSTLAKQYEYFAEHPAAQ